jgi:hypothetical protein
LEKILTVKQLKELLAQNKDESWVVIPTSGTLLILDPFGGPSVKAELPVRANIEYRR